MTPIVTFALLAASLSGAMSAPVSHDTKVDVAALHTKHSGFGTIGTEQFHHDACGDIEYSSSDAVVAINAAQFGSFKHKSFTCGKYVKVNRTDSESTHYMYKVVDVCKNCEETSLLFSERALRQFSNQDRLPIDWGLVDDAKEDEYDNDHTSKPDWKSESKPEFKPTGHHIGCTYRGRGTWFSDTRGSCGVDFSQDEMIVTLNEAQQGEQCGSDSQCFKKIRVSVKSDPSNNVVVRIVD